MSIQSVIPSNYLILCHPLLLPSTFLNIGVFSRESVLHIRWPKYGSFSFSISPSNEYLGLISFRIDWFDLLAVQETPKSLLQHNSKALIFQCLASLWSNSHIYMTPGETIALTIWTFDSKMMSLLCNMLSSFVIAFLSRSQCILISWLQSPFAVILEPKKREPVTASTFSSSICHENDGTGCHDLSFFNFELEASVFTLLFHPH